MEIARFPSRGGFSVRSIFTFVLAVVITALLWATFVSTPTQAIGTASWQGGGSTVLLDQHGYTEATDFSDPTNTIPEGSTVYKTPVINGEGATTSSKIFILYFSPGVDPPTATSATYVEFNYDDEQISNPQNQQDVTVTPQTASGESGGSCSVSGIGWIICPVSNFLADGMDGIFSILSGMIAVQPAILGDSNNSMYVAWNIMRTIANIAFVIAFLIIIYSQLTSYGVSNYGIKKLIPRLIVAAVLVNLSFFITALAIDISNVLGYSVQDAFNSIREETFHLTNDNISGFNTNAWGTVTGIILAGGGIVGGVYFVAGGGLYLLIPLLIGLILTLIFVVIILAARQAIIVILVIISPLAFVANLLPNTEKWFEKWKDLFMTMLIFFPAFSLVFGGSQLAGQIIIQNAGDNIVSLLFGMAVQIAPLVITPLILKLSGGLLGRIAQLTNNPQKGMLDRSKNWARGRAEHTKQQNIARGVRGNPASWGAGMVRRMDYRKRRLSDSTDAWKQEATNRYEETGKYGKIHERKVAADLGKDRVHSQHATHIDHLKNKTGSQLNLRTIEAEEAKVAADLSGAQTSAMVSAYRAGVYNTEGNERLGKLQQNMAKNVISTAAWKRSEEESQYLQQRFTSEAMRKDSSLLDIAQGYGSVEFQAIARERAQANAVATLTKLNRDARENAITLIETEAVESGDSVKDYAIQEIFAKAERGEHVSPTRLEAALEIAASDGQVGVFDRARENEYIDQALIDAVVARHVGDMKSKGGFHIQADPQLSLQRYLEAFRKGEYADDDTVNSEADVRAKFALDLKRARLGTLSNTNSANLGGVKFGAFQKLAEDMFSKDPKKNLLTAIPVDANGKPVDENDAAMIERIFESLRDGLSDPSTRATMTDRLAHARKMEEGLRQSFFPDKPPLELSDSERAKAGGGTRPASMADNPDLPAPSGDVTDESPSEDQDN